MSTALVLLAAASPGPASPGPASPGPASLGNPGDNPNHVGPGAVAFWIVIALGVGLFLLVKSMGRQMRRIDFDDGSEPGDAAPGSNDRRRSGSPATRNDANEPVPTDLRISRRRPPRRR